MQVNCNPRLDEEGRLPHRDVLLARLRDLPQLLLELTHPLKTGGDLGLVAAMNFQLRFSPNVLGE